MRSNDKYNLLCSNYLHKCVLAFSLYDGLSITLTASKLLQQSRLIFSSSRIAGMWIRMNTKTGHLSLVCTYNVICNIQYIGPAVYDRHRRGCNGLTRLLNTHLLCTVRRPHDESKMFDTYTLTTSDLSC